MALFLVLQDYQSAGEVHFTAGDLIDDALQPIQALQAGSLAAVEFVPATMQAPLDLFLSYRNTRNDIGGEYLSSLLLNAGAFGTAGTPTGPAIGDLTGNYPGPLVRDLTIAGELQGSVLYFDGANWAQLQHGTPNQVLTTQGLTTAPIWRDLDTILPANLVTDFQTEGAGEPITRTLVGNILTFKSIVAGSGITLSSDANELTVSVDATGAFLPLTGGTMSGPIDMGASAITNASTVNGVPLIATGSVGNLLNEAGAYAPLTQSNLLWMDAGTTIPLADQDGSFAAPFATVQQFIDSVVAATADGESFQVVTGMMASGQYLEGATALVEGNLIWNVGGRRIQLLGYGGPVSIGAFDSTTWSPSTTIMRTNIVVSGDGDNIGTDNVRSYVGIGMLPESSFPRGAVASSMTAFRISGKISATLTTTGSDGNVEWNIHDCEVFGTDGTSTGVSFEAPSDPNMTMVVKRTRFRGTFNAGNDGRVECADVVLSGLATVQSFSAWFRCEIDAGLFIHENASTSWTTARGLFQCSFVGLFDGADATPELLLDQDTFNSFTANGATLGTGAFLTIRDAVQIQDEGVPVVSQPIIDFQGPGVSVTNGVGKIIVTVGAGSGDFVGPGSSVTGNLVSFADTTGKLGADSGVLASSIVLDARTLTAGAGLTGGGDLSADRTFDVVANADGSIVVNADDLQVGILATDAQHGVRGGGTQHADATGSVSGFMSSGDKTAFDLGPFLPLGGGTMAGNILVGGNDITGAGIITATTFNGVALIDSGTGDLILGDNGAYKVDVGRFAGATGWLDGGIVSQASGTTVDVTAGAGRVTDYSAPLDPVDTEVPWVEQLGVVITAVATTDVTLIAFDSTGTLVQFLQSTVTRADYRTHVFVGEVGHSGGVIEGAGSTVGNVAYDGQATLSDFLEVIGPTQRFGVEIVANVAANLTLDHDAGQLFISNRNVRNDPTVGDLNPIIAASPLVMRRVFRDNLSSSVKVQNLIPDSDIDPGFFDDGSGTLQVVAANDWTNQRIFVGSGGTVLVGFGQETYNTRALAVAALTTETFVEQSPLATFALRAFLTVKGNATDLTDAADAQITRASKFRVFGTSGGGVQAAGSFIALTDTPAAYTGEAGKSAVVTDAETGLEFRSIGGGGAVTLEWNWDTTTTDADPGSGNVRGNDADQSLITQLFSSDVTANGKDVSTILAALSAGDILIVTEEADSSRWIIAEINGAVVDATTYFKLPVNIAQNGAAIRNGRTVAVQVISQGAGGVPPSRTLTAGAGLTGGGDLSADRTFDVVANADGSMVINANDLQVGVLATDAQHGLRGGDTQHALATGSVHGFMSSTDKTAFDLGPFLPLGGGTLSGVLNMGTNAITNAGAITSTGFSGPLTGNVTGDVNSVTLTAAGVATNFLNEAGNYVAPAGGGDFTGPVSSVTGNLVSFADTTGKLGSDSGVLASDVSTHLASTANPHATDLGNIGAGTLAELNAAVSDATLIPDTRDLIAGNGLVGGGNLSADRTFTVVGGDASIVVNANDIVVGVLQTDAQHGLRGGGTQHAVATGAVNGFMSSVDKTAFDLGPFLPLGGGTLSGALNMGTNAITNAGAVTSTGFSGPVNGVTLTTGGVVTDFLNATGAYSVPAGEVPAARTLTAGAGLTGGGDLSANRTFDVVANGDGSMVINANDIQVGVISNAQHGNRAGGALHAVAIAGGADGFFTGVDKTKIDGIAANAAAVTSTAPVDVTKAAAAVGVSADAARQDHKHDVATAVAVAVGTANAEGSSTSLARADHVHLALYDFADNLFRVQDNLDATKELAFQIAGLTTATIRTITMPDADTTLYIKEGLAGGQTLTGDTAASGNLSLASTANATKGDVIVVDGVMLFPDVTAPGNPADAEGRLYKKAGNDGLFWLPDSGGAEVDLTASVASNEFSDALFRIQDNGDNTKELAFEVAGITTATLRTITMPDASTTLYIKEGLSGGQTLVGDTVASGNLVLESTANATKGNVVLGTGTTLDASDEDVINAKTITFGNGATQTTSGTTLTIDLAAGQKHIITLASTITTVVILDPLGAGNFSLKFVQNGTGSFAVSGWPANVFWLGGTEPTFGDAANTRRLVSLAYDGPSSDEYLGEFNAGIYS